MSSKKNSVRRTKKNYKSGGGGLPAGIYHALVIMKPDNKTIETVYLSSDYFLPTNSQWKPTEKGIKYTGMIDLRPNAINKSFMQFSRVADSVTVFNEPISIQGIVPTQIP